METGLCSWKSLRLARSEKGKPHVSDLERVLFSVSHHGRLTVLAAEIFDEAVGSKSTSMSTVQLTDVLNSTSDRNGSVESSNTDKLKLAVHTECESKTSKETGDTLSSTIAGMGEAVNSAEEESTAPSLGVDICNQDLPRNTSIPEFFRLMRRTFHEDEWRYILAAPIQATQLARFYRLWSLKESFVKATGTGITVPLNEICFHVASELELEKCVYDTQVVLRGQTAPEWNFEETRLKDHYCVAVAMCGASPGDKSVEKRYEEVTFSDVEALMEDVEVNEEEELFYMAQDFVKKQLRPWCS